MHSFTHSLIHSFILQVFTECLQRVWHFNKCWKYYEGEIDVVYGFGGWGREGNGVNYKL